MANKVYTGMSVGAPLDSAVSVFSNKRKYILVGVAFNEASMPLIRKRRAYHHVKLDAQFCCAMCCALVNEWANA